MGKWGSAGTYAKAMSYANRSMVLRAPVRRRPPLKRPGAPLRMGPLVRPVMRMRSGRSYTQTVTKRKKKPGQVTTHGDNQSTSFNSIGKRFMSPFDAQMAKKIVAPQSYFGNSVFNAVSTQGKQGAYVSTIMNKPTLTAIANQANGGVATDVPIRIVLKSGKTTMKIRNNANSNCKLTVYDIVTKRAPPTSTLDSPLTCWTKGIADYGYAAGNEVVGQTPFRSPEFNEYFAVNRVTSVSLEPGQQHDHTVYHKWNKIMDSIRFQNSVSNSLPGLTRFIMIVYHGNLGHESVTNSKITYMPVGLDIAMSVDYTYGWVEKVARAYQIADTNGTTVVDFDFMGEAGDVDTNAAIG